MKKIPRELLLQNPELEQLKGSKRTEREPSDLVRVNRYRIQFKKRSGKERTNFKDLNWK